MAARATTPTTTPAAIPALLGPLSLLSESEEGVLLAEAEALVIDEEVDLDEELDTSGTKFSTLFRVVPVSLTSNLPGPPPAGC